MSNQVLPGGPHHGCWRQPDRPQPASSEMSSPRTPCGAFPVSYELLPRIDIEPLGGGQSKGRKRCRMHDGTPARPPKGNRKALRHGGHSSRASTLRQAANLPMRNDWKQTSTRQQQMVRPRQSNGHHELRSPKRAARAKSLLAPVVPLPWTNALKWPLPLDGCATWTKRTPFESKATGLIRTTGPRTFAIRSEIAIM